MSPQLHSTSSPVFFKDRRPLILLILFFYFLLLTTPTLGKPQVHSHGQAIGTYLFKRSLPSTGYGDTTSPTHNGQTSRETGDSTGPSLETKQPTDTSTLIPTDNRDYPKSSDTPTEQVHQEARDTAARMDDATQTAPITGESAVVAATEGLTEATSTKTDTYLTNEMTTTKLSGQSSATATESATDVASSTLITENPASPTSTEAPTSSIPASKVTPSYSEVSTESTTILDHSTTSPATPSPTSITSFSPLTNTNSQSTLMATSAAATTANSEPSFSSTLYTTRSFSITSSTAVPSLVLGKNECASDTQAINGVCPDDYFCNAALKTCIPLKNNGEQCYEDFQCLSSYCGNVCTKPPSAAPSTILTGGQIAGITLGCVSGAVVLVLGLIRWQKRSRQLQKRAARFKDFGEEQGGSTRLSKYNFLAQAFHGDQPRASQDMDHYDVDDAQFYASTQHLSMDSSPQFYDPGLQAAPGSRMTMHSTMEAVPPGALTGTSGGIDHNPFRPLDQRNYEYF